MRLTGTRSARTRAVPPPPPRRPLPPTPGPASPCLRPLDAAPAPVARVTLCLLSSRLVVAVACPLAPRRGPGPEGCFPSSPPPQVHAHLSAPGSADYCLRIFSSFRKELYRFCHDFVLKSFLFFLYYYLFKVIFKMSSRFHFPGLDSMVHLVGGEDGRGSLARDPRPRALLLKAAASASIFSKRWRPRLWRSERLWKVGDHWGNKVSAPGCAN